MPTITIPDKSVVNIGRGGKYGALPVEWSRVPQNVLDHIWETYSAQYITDASNSGGTESTGEDRVALANKKLDQMYAGEVRAHRAAGEPANPVEAEVYKMAIANMRLMLSDIAVPKSVKGPIPRLLHQINMSRATRNLEPVPTILVAVALYMAGPQGKKVQASAERIVRERQAAAGELADSGI